MMKRENFIYFITASCFALTVLVSGIYLARSMQPSADVLAEYEYNFPRVDIADFEPGDARVVLLNDIHVVVWRRNADDIETATQQDDPELWIKQHSRILGEPSLQFARDRNLTIDQEWFFAWALNPGGLGCVVIVREGNYGGFFDPCRGAHFDLAGRVRKGPSPENLVIIPAQIAEDGRSFRLDLTHSRLLK